MIKILLVDDDPDLRALLKVWVQGTDFELIVAADGYQAVQFARTEQPDVILLDVHMPAAKGFIVHERLKRLHSLANVPVIFISADRTTAEQAIAEGGTDFLPKPLDKDRLMRTLRRVLKMSS